MNPGTPKPIVALRYEPSTKTIRTVPENYCVASAASFAESGTMDAAIQNKEEVLQIMAASFAMKEALEAIFMQCSFEHVSDWRESRKLIGEIAGLALLLVERNQTPEPNTLESKK